MKSLVRYARKQYRSLKGQLRSEAPQIDPELLHKVRVEIKKLKALQLAAGAFSKSYKSHKHYKPLRKIFRAAGDVRQPWLLRKKMLEYHLVLPQEQAESMEADHWANLFKLFRSRVKAGRRPLLEQLSRIKQRKFEVYLSRLGAELVKVLYPTIDFPRLHKIRKSMKVLVYLATAVKADQNEFIQTLDQMERLAGEHHDILMLLDLLQKDGPPDAQKVQHLHNECEKLEQELTLLAARLPQLQFPAR